MALTFSRVLENICRPVMETVPVFSSGKFREHGKKKRRKYGENLWTIFAILLRLRVGFKLKGLTGMQYLFDLRFPGFVLRFSQASFFECQPFSS